MLNPLNLSKLSRGKGERKGSYIQVIYDDRDLNERNYGEFYRNHILDDNRHINLDAIHEQRKLNLPKTFTTRKGPLLLFSEDSRVQSDLLGDNSLVDKQSEINHELKSLKTTRNLRKSILEFGGNLEYNESSNEYPSQTNETSDSFEMEREKTLATFSLFKEIKSIDDQQFEKIRPGFSAKRYLSNWTRHWRPELFDNLAKNGRIKEETLFESIPDSVPNSKQRIDDDISRIPPVYRINRKWLTMAVQPLKGYRFYRVKTDLMGLYDETTEASVGGAPIAPTDNIQVLDKEGNNIDYLNLSKSDKEIVLTELLLQTALQSIAEKRIESIEETFKNYMLANNSQMDPAFLSQSDPALLNGKLSVKELDPNELISTSTYVNNSNNNTFVSNLAKSVTNHLFPRMNGNKLSPINKTNKITKPSLENQKSKTNQQNRLNPNLVTNQIEAEEPTESIEIKFASNSLQNFQTTTILEEKEEEILDLQNLNKNESILIEINEQIEKPHSTPLPENKELIEKPKSGEKIEFNQQAEKPKPIENNDLIEKPKSDDNIENNQLVEKQTIFENKEKIDQMIEPEHKSNQLHISFILPEAPELPDSAINNKMKNSALTMENTQLEIDPRILEYEKHEEELLRKELEEEEQNKLEKKQEEMNKNKPKEELMAQTALNDMLSKKHYQSMISISNISIGDAASFDMIAEKQALASKKKERFILNRHNYHHPRKPKNNLIELYKQAQLPPNIQLGDSLNFNNVREKDTSSFIEKLVKPKSNEKKTKSNSTSSTGKVIVLGPDGNITQIGSKIDDATVQNKQPKKKPEIFYRLFDEIPPYLYYTNKIDTNTTYVKYEREDSAKLIAEKDLAAKKAAQEILGPEKEEKENEEEPIVNKQVLDALQTHAQNMAKIALDSNGSGMDLVKDIKLALYENYKKLKQAYRANEIDTKEYEEYTALMKEALKTSLSELFAKSIDFSNVIIDDGLLGNLLEYPTSAFEIVTDPETKRRIIQIKKSYKPINTNLANEMNLDLEQIENEVKNKTFQRSLIKDAKLETNVTKNIIPIEQSKKDDDGEDEDENKDDKKPTLPDPNEKQAEDKEEPEESEAKEKKAKKKAKKPKPKEGEEGAADGEKKKDKSKAKGGKNKSKKDKSNEVKVETEETKEDENLDPKELKRRQQAEEKKKEMLRRRLEQDEKKRREEEELLRLANEAKAAEEEKRRQEEELERRREAEREKKRKLQEAAQERERLKREEEEAKQRAAEEAARKMEEMRIKFIEELTLKAKMEEEEKLNEKRKKIEEEELQYEMAEKERLEIIRRQEEYEAAERRRYEEENLRREQELAYAIEKARCMAEEEAERAVENERRTQFVTMMKREKALFNLNDSVSRAFVFSYYDLIKFLGCEIMGPRDVQLILDGGGSLLDPEPKKKKK